MESNLKTLRWDAKKLQTFEDESRLQQGSDGAQKRLFAYFCQFRSPLLSEKAGNFRFFACQIYFFKNFPPIGTKTPERLVKNKKKLLLQKVHFVSFPKL